MAALAFAGVQAQAAPVGSPQIEACPNEQVRSEQPASLVLPDCRAYEMVSPLVKGDSDATEPFESQARAAVSGEALTYGSRGSFAGAKGSTGENQYVSRRGPDGWSTQSITPPFSSFQTTLFDAYAALVFTPDLSKGIALTDVPLTADARAGFENVYLADIASGSYRLVSTGTPLEEPYNFRELPEFEGASTDLTSVVYEEVGVIHEWVNGQSQIVNVDDHGEPINAAVGGGTQAGAVAAPPLRPDQWRAVSNDGARVYLTSPRSYTETNRQLYVREHGTIVEVSASQRTDCADHSPCSGTPEPDPNGSQNARYWGASSDGSKVLFTSCARLTNDATAVASTGSVEDPCLPAPGESGSDLYEYDLQSGTLKDLTVDASPSDPDGAAVLGVIYISEDASNVYFVAEGALAAGAVRGKPNLYLIHDGTAPRLIATLLPAEEVYEGNRGDASDWQEGPVRDTATATPDGTHLAFLSARSLTGYDNTDANTGLPDAEVYAYDAETATLACASCNPSGGRPVGPSTVGGANSYRDLYAPNDFAGDGRRLFFESQDALVPYDSNGHQDVYEYEDGQVHPISDVAGNYESFLLDAGSTGNDVFIATADELVPGDQDRRIDVYDARSDGGFPASVSPPVCENGDSCKPPVSAQPEIFGAPASATFSGAGNLAPTPVVKPKPKAKPKSEPKPCRKGQVRKRGKCVKAKSKHSSGHSKQGRK